MEKMELGANFKSWYHIVVTKENFFLVKLWKFHMSFSVLNNFFLKKWKLVNLEFPNEICQIGSLWCLSVCPICLSVLQQMKKILLWWLFFISNMSLSHMCACLFLMWVCPILIYLPHPKGEEKAAKSSLFASIGKPFLY